MNAAENRTCPKGDASLEKIGYDSIQAGVDVPMFTGTADHRRNGKLVGLAEKSGK